MYGDVLDVLVVYQNAKFAFLILVHTPLKDLYLWRARHDGIRLRKLVSAED